MKETSSNKIVYLHEITRKAFYSYAIRVVFHFVRITPPAEADSSFFVYEELKNGIDEYILFYNQIRPHKKLKYVSPCEFEEAYYNNLQS